MESHEFYYENGKTESAEAHSEGYQTLETDYEEF